MKGSDDGARTARLLDQESGQRNGSVQAILPRLPASIRPGGRGLSVCRGQSNRTSASSPSSATVKLHAAARHSLGLVINFNEQKLTDGLSRLILPGANLE